MGLILGGVQHWLERGDGIDSWGLAMGARDTGWIWVMGLIYGDASWGCTTRSGVGIDLWGCAMGEQDTGWIRMMGLINGGT